MDLALLKRFEDTLREQVPDFRVAFKDRSWSQKVLGFLVRPFNPRFMSAFTTTMGSTVYFPSQAFYEANPERSLVILAHEFVHIWDHEHDFWFKLKYMFPQVLGLIPLLIYGFLAGSSAWVAAVPLAGYLLGCLVARFSRVAFMASAALGLLVMIALGGYLTGWSTLALLGLGLLAPWPAPWRVKSELGGYGMNIALAQWKGRQPPPATYLHNLSKHFTGPDYYFMSWNREYVERTLEATRQQAEMGVLQRLPPYQVVYDFLYRSGLLPRTSLRP